jgi:hypothetical protein
MRSQKKCVVCARHQKRKETPFIGGQSVEFSFVLTIVPRNFTPIKLQN